MWCVFVSGDLSDRQQNKHEWFLGGAEAFGVCGAVWATRTECALFVADGTGGGGIDV